MEQPLGLYTLMAVLVGTLYYCQKYRLLPSMPCAHSSKTYYPNDAKLITKMEIVQPQRRTSGWFTPPCGIVFTFTPFNYYQAECHVATET